MSTGKMIYGVLSTNTAVSALVSTRIYPLTAPDKTASPYIVYEVMTGNSTQRAQSSGNLAREEILISAYAETYKGATDLASAIADALDRLHGTYSGVDVRDFVSSSYFDAYDNDTAKFCRATHYKATVRA